MLKIAVARLFIRGGSFLLLAGLVWNCPAVASVPVPVGPELGIATLRSEEEQAPAIVHLGSGSFVAIWQQSDSGQDVKGLCFDSEGVSVPTFDVNSTLGGDQTNADVVSDGSGGFVVVWQSHDSGSTCDEVAECTIRAQRLDASCTRIPPGEIIISTATVGSRERPRIDRGTDGDYLVVWQSDQDGTEDIYARILNSDGTFGSSETIIHANPDGSQTAPAVAARLSSEYVVTWEGDTDIKARQVDSSAAGTGTEITVNTTTVGSQTQPAVAAKSNGEFAVVWVNDTSDSEVFIQGFSDAAAISPSGGELIVNAEVITGDQSEPDILVGSDGKFVVAWVNSMPPLPLNMAFGAPIFINSLAASGPPFAFLRSTVGPTPHLDAPRQVLNLLEGVKSKARIATDSEDNYLVVWQGRDASSDAVIGRKVEHLIIFNDNFESGNVSAWSLSSP